MSDAGRLLRFARAWFDEDTVVRVFEPLVADLASGTRIRLYRAFAAAFVSSFPRTLKPPLQPEL